LAAAFGYFTIFPVINRQITPPTAPMIAYLPTVGIVIGAISGGVAYGLALFGLKPLGIALGFALPILLTGALHVDGFLDSADALLACVDPQERFRIMKDPQHGTFAIAYFVALCAVWIAALVMLPPTAMPAALAYAGGLSRWSAALNLVRYPYAGTEGISIPALGINALLVIALSFTLGWFAWIAVPLVVLKSLVVGRIAAGRLGGRLVGDVYGALIVIGEVATLTICAVILTLV
jgi:adenosylcobinamide-GDP ribazoletransferase